MKLDVAAGSGQVHLEGATRSVAVRVARPPEAYSGVSNLYGGRRPAKGQTFTRPLIWLRTSGPTYPMEARVWNPSAKRGFSAAIRDATIVDYPLVSRVFGDQ